jgi:hypothetical protein
MRRLRTTGPPEARAARLKAVAIGTNGNGEIRAQVFNQPEGAPRSGELPSRRDAHHEKGNKYSTLVPYLQA